jgi:hypothetical protein
VLVLLQVSLDPIRVLLPITRHQETKFGPIQAEKLCGTVQRREVVFHFAASGTGQQAYDSATTLPLLLEKSFVVPLLVQSIAVRMTDIFRSHTATTEPCRFERQSTKYPFHQPTHFAYPPASPGPQLRRDKVPDGNAVLPSATRHPPVETGIVHQHHQVGSGAREPLLHLSQQTNKEGKRCTAGHNPITGSSARG